MKRLRSPYFLFLSLFFLLFLLSYGTRAWALESSRVKEISEPNREVVLSPNEAAYVNSFFPSTSFSGDSILETAFSEANKLAFLRFDFSSLPKNNRLATATLSAYLESGSGEEEVPLEVYRTLGDWCADQLTWASKPPLSHTATSSAVPVKPGLISWDITPLVASWLSGENNYGLVLGEDKVSFERTFSGVKSKNPPHLSLVFDEPIVTSDEGNGEASVSGRISANAKISPQATASAVVAKRPCKVLGDSQNKLSTENTFSSGVERRYLLAGVAFLLIAFFAITNLKTLEGIKRPKK